MPTITAVRTMKEGQKNGKKWTMFGVDLDDGQKASGFDQVAVGDTVNVVQSGKYLNYTKADGSQPTSTSTSTNGHRDASAAYRNGNGDSHDDNIKWQCMLKVAGLIYAGAGADSVDKVMATARFMFHEPIDIVEEAKKLFNATEATDPVKPF